MATLLQLHGLHGLPTIESTAGCQDLPLDRRIELSKKWAAWAPGLKLAIATAIQEHLQALEHET